MQAREKYEACVTIKKDALCGPFAHRKAGGPVSEYLPMGLERPLGLALVDLAYALERKLGR